MQYRKGGGQGPHQDFEKLTGLRRETTWRSTLAIAQKVDDAAADFTIGRFDAGSLSSVARRGVGGLETGFTSIVEVEREHGTVVTMGPIAAGSWPAPGCITRLLNSRKKIHHSAKAAPADCCVLVLNSVRDRA